jgi:hypothetical protein
MSTMPRPLAAAGVWVLRTEQLRMAANRMAYHDQVGLIAQGLGYCTRHRRGMGGGVHRRPMRGPMMPDALTKRHPTTRCAALGGISKVPLKTSQDVMRCSGMGECESS